MVSKTIGYILSGIGIIGISLGAMPNLKKAIKIIPEGLNDMYIMGAGLLIVALGVIILIKNPSSKTPPEVPIYDQKNNIVGYKRMKK